MQAACFNLEATGVHRHTVARVQVQADIVDRESARHFKTLRFDRETEFRCDACVVHGQSVSDLESVDYDAESTGGDRQAARRD